MQMHVILVICLCNLFCDCKRQSHLTPLVPCSCAELPLRQSLVLAPSSASTWALTRLIVLAATITSISSVNIERSTDSTGCGDEIFAYSKFASTLTVIYVPERDEEDRRRSWNSADVAATAAAADLHREANRRGTVTARSHWLPVSVPAVSWACHWTKIMMKRPRACRCVAWERSTCKWRCNRL